MPKIVPLRELNNASNISTMCHELHEPVFVTKSGKSDLVIMSSDVYDEITKHQRSNFYQASVQEPVAVAESDSLSAYMSQRDSKKIYSIAEIKQILQPIFKKHGVLKAVLFGSYVKGTADTRSDIDLMVQTNLKGLAFYGLLGDVTDALHFPVDFIEKRQIEDGSEIATEIEQTGVTIYG